MEEAINEFISIVADENYDRIIQDTNSVEIHFASLKNETVEEAKKEIIDKYGVVIQNKEPNKEVKSGYVGARYVFE